MGGGTGGSEVAAVRIARAALVVLPRPEFSPERAARQGDRVLPAGGEGESADGGAAVRARQPLSPPRRGRPRDPHAPGPHEPRGPSPRAAARGLLRALAGLFQGGGPPSPPAGALHDGG